ncbi:MAG: PPC domain-containing DNA-binding protein [Patescibacteria group bacterium]
MNYQKFDNTYVIRIDKGEELVGTLKEFCTKEKIQLATLTGVGAVDQIKVGFFDTEKKEYHSQEFKGGFEVSSLCGNVSSMDGESYLHLHVNFCGQDNRTYGGHLDSALVGATFEATLISIEGSVDRKFNEAIGLNLLKFDGDS